MNQQQKNSPSMQTEDAPTMSAGSGDIAGIGVGAQGEPGAPPRSIVRRKKFAGAEVFEVNADWFHKARLGKKKYTRYENYVGDDEIGQAIRAYAHEDYSRPIVIQDERTGAMCYLRYGKK